MKRFQYLFCLTALLVPMIACHSQPSDVVRRTIKTYQVGVTTFADFKKDAGVVETKPVADNPPHHSYLDPQSDALEAKMPEMILYTIPEKSPWKLLEEGTETSSETHTTSIPVLGKPTGSSSHSVKTKFAIGDAKGPVCILIFDGAGRLAEIKPLP